MFFSRRQGVFISPVLEERLVGRLFLFGSAAKPQYSKRGDLLGEDLNVLKKRPQVGASGLQEHSSQFE